jgi:AraC family transcriptional regulator, transcriptional activator FtrA
MRNGTVVALAYDGLCTFEFGIVVEVFGLRRPELDVPWYRFSVCGLKKGPMRATGGVTLRATAGLEAFSRAGTIVIPGWCDAAAPPPPRLLDALRRAHKRGARLVSICSGVFVLAAAGVLDGRRATTHWRYASQLAERYPTVQVDPDVLYIDEGNVLTSAGSAAGIDLLLHIVRLDYGAAIANQVAKRLVVPPHRDGGQAQYVSAPVRENGERGLASLLDWARRHLQQPLAIAQLARRAAMSERNFARRFRAETGTTPHRWLTHERLLAAQRLLETTDDSIDRIAEEVGLQTSPTLRHHFRRIFHTSPAAYRRRFALKP